MTIHSTHPFAGGPDDLLRRLRGRLGGAVTLWTADAARGRVGWTVSSVLAVPGEPPRLLGLLDPDADLTDALEDGGRAVVQVLHWRHRDLAEMFAGLAPAPGGAFGFAGWERTAWGPRLADAAVWAGVRLEQARDVGWSREVQVVVEHLEVGEEDDALTHRRGRYGRSGEESSGPAPA